MLMKIIIIRRLFMFIHCSFSCPTCGYKLSEFMARCPRCSTFLLEIFKCPGNCSQCKNKKTTTGKS